MKDFNRKVEQASARLNRKFAEAASNLEEETTELVDYLNNEVVPAVREHSTKALRIASKKLAQFADYMDERRSSDR